MEKSIYWFPFIKITQQIIQYYGSGSKISWNQTFDLLQLELSYFFNCEIVTFLLQVPTVPLGPILRLIKLHPFPLPNSRNYSIIKDMDTQFLAMSTSSIEMLLLFPAVNLPGCSQASLTVWQSQNLEKHLTSMCLGALYKQQLNRTRELCPMKIITSEEILYRLDKNKQLVNSPQGQTIPIPGPTKKLGQKELFLPQRVSEFKFEAGCKIELVNNIFNVSSISV